LRQISSVPPCRHSRSNMVPSWMAGTIRMIYSSPRISDQPMLLFSISPFASMRTSS
jgi:hypothetical protein